uniref:30S ribosomal protein S8, chloroplastic n=1 Tax=Araucaria cunninghamii TaxID=56994 RepID=A0A0D6R8K6_ARACU
MGLRILNEALRKMVNAERRGFGKVELQPVSILMANFLNIMKYRGYIKDLEVFDIHRKGKITVELNGRIKDCKALTYRQDIKPKDIETYRSRILPTRQWGYVVITSSKGVMDHEEAMKQNAGGKVLGYFY